MMAFVISGAMWGCDDDSTLSGIDHEISSWPTWREFSPVLKSEHSLTSETEAYDEVVEQEGRDTAYLCTTKTYTITETPEKMIMFTPDLEILWPGALIRGKSLRDGEGVGSLLALTIDERKPVEISIPSLKNEDNFRVVGNPTQASVSQVIGSMVGSATMADLKAPSSVQYNMKETQSSQEFALSSSMSARYLGFTVSAEASVKRKANSNTVVAHFYERMYEVVLAPPSTPSGFFSDGFDKEALSAQVKLGRMGPDNLPVYVSNVVYGRMLIFTFTSTASVTEIQSALDASYSGVGGNIDATAKKILEEGEIEVTTLGGDGDAVADMIRGGNLSEYFNSAAALSTATPLSYTFRNLSDGTIAKVSETTEYNIKECDVQTKEEDDNYIKDCEWAEVLEHNGHKYWTCDLELSWKDAVDYCALHDSHLVTVTDVVESEHVNTLSAKFKNRENPLVWLGADTKEKTQDSFSWITGETFDYANWGNQLECGYEHTCLVLSLEKTPYDWQCVPCEKQNWAFDIIKIPFICERDI